MIRKHIYLPIETARRFENLSKGVREAIRRADLYEEMIEEIQSHLFREGTTTEMRLSLIAQTMRTYRRMAKQ